MLLYRSLILIKWYSDSYASIISQILDIGTKINLADILDALQFGDKTLSFNLNFTEKSIEYVIVWVQCCSIWN